MDCFQTITQFANIDNIESENNNYNKNACHFFSLKTSYEFIKNKRIDKEAHEANIYFAMNLNKLYQNKDLFFDEVIGFTDLGKSTIGVTTTELLKSGDYPITLIFPETENAYSVIILKNSKYFVVNYNNNNFYLRDCHEPFQYNFTSRVGLYDYLNKTYQFNEPIIVDGYPIPEFSAIEFIIIYKPFEFHAVSEINSISKPLVYMKETEFGLMIEDTHYENNEEVVISKILESFYKKTDLNNDYKEKESNINIKDINEYISNSDSDSDSDTEKINYYKENI